MMVAGERGPDEGLDGRRTFKPSTIGPESVIRREDGPTTTAHYDFAWPAGQHFQGTVRVFDRHWRYSTDHSD